MGNNSQNGFWVKEVSKFLWVWESIENGSSNGIIQDGFRKKIKKDQVFDRIISALKIGLDSFEPF